MQPRPDDRFFAKRNGGRHEESQAAVAVVLGLMADARTADEQIQVSVQNGVVVLTGSATSWTARAAAGVLVRRAVGPVDVCNRIRVDPAAGPKPADEFDDIVARLLPPRMDQLAGWRTDPGAPVRSILLIVVGLWLCLPFVMVVTGMPWPVAVCLGAAAAAAVVFVAGSRRGVRMEGPA